MKEQWKEIKNSKYKLYYVSDLGRCKTVLKRTSKEKISNGILNLQTGYVQFAGNYVHRLVAEAFLPNPDCKPQVDHINNDKQDNRACNLRWTTIKFNNSRKHAKDLRKLHRRQTTHRNLRIEASKDGVIKIFKSGIKCSLFLKCSHVHVYNALNKRGSARKAKGWTLRWIDI